MNEREYNARSREQNGGNWSVPGEFFTDNEFDIEKTLTYLYSSDLVGFSVDGRMVFSPKLESTMPEVHKLLITIMRDAEQAKMDKLVEAGLATQEINSDAVLVYRHSDGVRLLNSWDMVV